MGWSSTKNITKCLIIHNLSVNSESEYVRPIKAKGEGYVLKTSNTRHTQTQHLKYSKCGLYYESGVVLQRHT